MFHCRANIWFLLNAFFSFSHTCELWHLKNKCISTKSDILRDIAIVEDLITHLLKTLPQHYTRSKQNADCCLTSFVALASIPTYFLCNQATPVLDPRILLSLFLYKIDQI